MERLLRLKRFLTGASAVPDDPYVCLDCESAFERRHQVCPDCGGYDIRSTEWLDRTRQSREESA